MLKHFALCLSLFALTLPAFAASKKTNGAGAPDKALMQTIWSGWATLDPANVDKYYATGDHVFFDIAPLKYASWDEYKKNVTNVLADFKSATCTVNDDAQVHSAGNVVWGTATIKYEMTHKSGKVDAGNFRWTVVWQKENGKWLIVHEHVSVPMQ